MPRLTVAADLHCHILPGLDDGARDLSDAVGMARQAQADGIAAVCATPHIRSDHPVRIAELPERLHTLSEALRRDGCPTRILPGGEVAAEAVARLTPSALAAVSLGGTGRWILLEPDAGPLDARLDRAVDHLHALGLRALIAHPERHLAVDLVTRLGRLIGAGALVQATAASFLDPGARAGMLALAAAGVIHVLGSDAHSSRAGRPVELARAAGDLAGVAALADHVHWIVDTAPRAIVAGHDLESPFPVSR